VGLVIGLVAAIALASLLTRARDRVTLVVGAPALGNACCRCSRRSASAAGRTGARGLGGRARAVVAVVVGAALGAVLPAVVLQGVDLRAFTGATRSRASRTIRGSSRRCWPVGARVGGGAWAAARIGSRVNAVAPMRKEEEG
jgi:putative ABC transport system permease protein